MRRRVAAVAAMALATVLVLVGVALLASPRPHRPAARVEPRSAAPLAPPASPPAAVRRPPPRGPAPPSDLPRDPLLAAIPPGASAVLTLEVNALLHTPLGRMWLACDPPDPWKELGDLRASGFDRAVDLDRVAVAWRGHEPAILLASGFFERTRWHEALRAARLDAPEPLVPDRRGRLEFTVPFCLFDCIPIEVGVWRDRVFAIAPSDASAVHEALERLDGGAELETFAFPPSMDPAEVTAVADTAVLGDLLALPAPWRGALASLPARVELRVDAMGPARATARIVSEDPAVLDRIAGLASSYLAARRREAADESAREFTEALEHLTVARAHGALTLAFEVPSETLERWAERCERAAAQPR